MKKIKIDIVSGFLGAGKTTFIKKLMEGVFLEETIVILENEFGRINIDMETLGRSGLTVKPIQAGCICCSSAEELPIGIAEIIEEFNPDRIIVEPTGIAKLSGLKEILKHRNLSKHCEIDHIVTVVDAKNYFLRTMISKEFFEDQIRESEIVFLSKTAGMEEEKIHNISTEVYKINPYCRIISDSWDSIPIDQFKILMAPLEEPNLATQKVRLRKTFINDYESYEYVKDIPFNIAQIKRFIEDIENHQFGEVYRLKGICTDLQCGKYSVEYVPGETIIKVLPDQEYTVRSSLCLIGRALEKNELNQFLDLLNCTVV